MPTIIKSTEGLEDQIIQLEGVIALETTLQEVKTATESTATSTAETSTKLDATNSKLDDLITATGGSGTVSNTTTVTAANASTLILAAKSDRTSYYIRNATKNKMYINFGATAVEGEGIELSKGDAVDGSDWDGVINAIWESGVNGTAEVIEISLT